MQTHAGEATEEEEEEPAKVYRRDEPKICIHVWRERELAKTWRPLPVLWGTQARRGGQREVI